MDFAHLLVRLPVLLLPVLCFLGALVYFDSFRLVRRAVILGLLVAGAASAGLALLINTAAFDALAVEFRIFSRYVAPWIEEALKALVIAWLIHSKRVGVPVDAAITGFATGAGFALVENIFYLLQKPDLATASMIMRGFSTAVMHGGATALFGVVSVVLADRRPHQFLVAVLPGLVAAVLLHSAYNMLLFRPALSMLLVLLVLPGVFYLVFRYSEDSLRDWLESGLDSNVETLALINGGEFLQSRMGEHLQSMAGRFGGETLADMLCLLRLHAELALRAKGLLIMKEFGVEPELDDEIRSKLQELRALESSLGKTGQFAIRPLLMATGKDLWQLRLLEAS
jgi:RsiW-degrading membrane proteinase PrsW (M82 family)